MLQVNSPKSLAAIETALVQAAQRRGINVLSVIHLGRLFQDKTPKPDRDAIVFTICRPDLSAALLAAETRFANFVPCRIVACEQEGSVTLEALTPAEICGLLGRRDLEAVAAPLEVFLREIMEEAASPAAGGHARAAARDAGPGATEGMVNSRAAIPQRVDCRGTKVEEIAGTGQHDAQGG
jgi:uncharacterized protein (DUF302 family)